MAERIIELVVDEGKWLPTAFAVSIIVVAIWLRRQRRKGAPPGHVTLCGLNSFYGCMIGTMAFGHLLAVTVKAAQGTLSGSAWLLYALGLALAVPAWWLAMSSLRLRQSERRTRRRAVALNAWLAISLLALGLHNMPLAVPAVLNITYHFHSRRATGLAIVTVTVVMYAALFVASLVFLASGGSFEQFQGIE